MAADVYQRWMDNSILCHSTKRGFGGVTPGRILNYVDATWRILAVANDCKAILKSTFFMSDANSFSSKS